MGQIESKNFKLKSGESAILRTATSSDAADLLALAKTVMSESQFTLTEADELDKTVEQEAQWIEEHRLHPTQIVIVCEMNGQLIANLDFMTGLRRRIFHHGEFGMGVRKDFWSQGIGAELLSALLDWAQINPAIEKVNLRVQATNNRAIHLYKKFGFEQEGYVKRYLKFSDGSYIDGILMAKFVK